MNIKIPENLLADSRLSLSEKMLLVGMLHWPGETKSFLAVKLAISKRHIQRLVKSCKNKRWLKVQVKDRNTKVGDRYIVVLKKEGGR